MSFDFLLNAWNLCPTDAILTYKGVVQTYRSEKNSVFLCSIEDDKCIACGKIKKEKRKRKM